MINLMRFSIKFGFWIIASILMAILYNALKLSVELVWMVGAVMGMAYIEFGNWVDRKIDELDNLKKSVDENK
jgi:hypothetical protein